MRTPLLCVSLLACALSTPVFVHAADPAPAPSPLTWFGDFRLRYEWDWDSQNGSGVPRADRDRARIRARAGLTYKLSDQLSLGLRARTGSRLSQQSPHLTFYANDDITDDFEVTLDRYYVQFKQGGLTSWFGRNTTPFWQPNEMFWDEDVTPTGVALSYEAKLSDGALTATAGTFLLPDGMTRLHGSLTGGQLKYSVAAAPSQFTVAGGLYGMAGKAGAVNLRNRNGARDYLIGVVSMQWATKFDRGLPLTLGIDYIHNFENYDATAVAPFSVRHLDETTGYVFSALYGQLKNPRDWQVGWYYASIGTLAVNASYSQDDWARFGSGPQSDVTDFKGHELRATYVLTKSMNLQARFFVVEARTSIQDGKRLRIDWNWRF